jgi:hypothetical protein
MQSLLDAASHIAAEIEKTRQHLAYLEQALEGLRPLITVEPRSGVLTYAVIRDVSTVEDVSVVKPARKARAAPAAAKPAKVATGGRSDKALKAAKAPMVATIARVPKTANGVKVEPDAKGARPSKDGASTAIPKTGNAVWLKALGRKTLSQAQLTEATLKVLGLSADEKVIIRNRAGAWLNGASKKGLVSSSVNGAGTKVYEAVKA